MHTPTISDKRHRFPSRIIAHVVWLYVRFNLSLREVEELMPERGLDVSYETIRRWSVKFGPLIAHVLRRRQPRPGDVWHLPSINGPMDCLRISHGKHTILQMRLGVFTQPLRVLIVQPGRSESSVWILPTTASHNGRKQEIRCAAGFFVPQVRAFSASAIAARALVR